MSWQTKLMALHAKLTAPAGLLLDACEAFDTAKSLAAVDAARVEFIGANGRVKQLQREWSAEGMHLPIEVLRDAIERSFTASVKRIEETPA